MPGFMVISLGQSGEFDLNITTMVINVKIKISFFEVYGIKVSGEAESGLRKPAPALHVDGEQQADA